VQARLFWCSSTVDADGIDGHDYVSTQLKGDIPENAIPTRCSLRIRNWTQSVGTGGIVRVLRMTTGVALDAQTGNTKNVQLAELQEAIRTHARTRTYGGEELCQTHQKNCTVVDQSKATWFRDWDDIQAAGTIHWAMEQNWDPSSNLDDFTMSLYNPSMTPIAILFEPFIAAVSGSSVGNTYEVSVRSQFLAHYPQGTMLANMSIDPATDPAGLTKHRNGEESKGSVLEKIGGAISHGASWAWNHRSQLMHGAYQAIKQWGPAIGQLALRA